MPYVIEADDSGILRRKGAAETDKDRVFKCKLCGWAYLNKYVEKQRSTARSVQRFGSTKVGSRKS